MQPYTPTKVPVTVYRSTDAGAPQLKAEAGSLKTLLKTCLVSGYGGKQGLGWQMHNESGNRAVFHFGAGFGLDVDDNANAPKAGFVAGENFKHSLNDTRVNSTMFFFNGFKDWMLVGHGQAFTLAISDRSLKRSQILMLGRFAGCYEDIGNILYLNTANSGPYFSPENFEPTYSRMRIAVSQYQDGGARPYRAAAAKPMIQFKDEAAPFPDALYQGYISSKVGMGNDLSLRCFLPLYCSYHDLNSLEELADLQDGCVKINLSNGGDKRYCFALDVTEWEV